MSTPLFITKDSATVGELSRLAAAAGVTPEVIAEPTSALARWRDAPFVCVGVDCLDDLALLQPQRREGAFVISAGPVHHDVFAAALEVGAEGVLELPRSEAWLVETLTDIGDSRAAPGTVLGVIAGSGGGGASILTCALGQVAARHGSALVMDADPLGAGLDLLLGLDSLPGIRWDALQRTTGRLSARSLRDAVPRRGRLGVLTWPLATQSTLQAFAVRSAVSAAQRGHDHVVIDLPRCHDALLSEIAARCHEVEVVVRPTLTGVASAARIVDRLRDQTRLRLVVRGHGISVDQIRALTGVNPTMAMPSQRGIDEAIDLGKGPVRMKRGPLYRTASQIWSAVMAEVA